MEYEVAIIAAGAALLGAAIGVIGSWVTTNVQLSHADRTRWHVDRRQLYARVLREARAELDGLERWARIAAINMDIAKDLPKTQAREEAIEEALLVASTTGHALHRLQLMWGYLDMLSTDARLKYSGAKGDAWDASVKDARDAIEAFRRAARVELGIDRPRRRLPFYRRLIRRR